MHDTDHAVLVLTCAGVVGIDVRQGIASCTRDK